MSPFVVFIEGILSFFSPCILPLLPVYMSYLSQNAKIVDDSGNVKYKQSVVLLYTVLFMIGVSLTFFVMVFALISSNSFLVKYNHEITIVGGLFIFILGTIQLIGIKFNVMQKNYNFMSKLNLKKMNYLNAILMGFLFSFGWTPCIGPYLTSIVVMAASQADQVQGIMLICWYALGFLIPFIFMGIFTKFILELIKKNQKMFKYTIKLGGIILIVVGLNMVYTTIKPVTSVTPEEIVLKSKQDFALYDQHGSMHQLSNYKDQTVILSFISTWCTYCKKELAVIQELHESDENVVFLTIIVPKTSELDQEMDEEGIKDWITDSGYTFPVLFDTTGEVFGKYGVNGLPTNFFIYPSGELNGYLPGYIEKDVLEHYIDLTKKGIE